MINEKRRSRMEGDYVFSMFCGVVLFVVFVPFFEGVFAAFGYDE